MIRKFSVVVVLGLLSFAGLLATGYLFISATATASLRSWYCGPSSLDHADPACRIGMKLLYWSVGCGTLTLVLAIATLWVYTDRLKGSNNSFKPKPLRGSA